MQVPVRVRTNRGIVDGFLLYFAPKRVMVRVEGKTIARKVTDIELDSESKAIVLAYPEIFDRRTAPKE